MARAARGEDEMASEASETMGRRGLWFPGVG